MKTGSFRVLANYKSFYLSLPYWLVWHSQDDTDYWRLYSPINSRYNEVSTLLSISRYLLLLCQNKTYLKRYLNRWPMVNFPSRNSVSLLFTTTIPLITLGNNSNTKQIICVTSQWEIEYLHCKHIRCFTLGKWEIS